MKKSLLLFTVVISSMLSSAQSFEGVITMIPDFKTKPDPKNHVTYFVKGNKVVMEPRGTGAMDGRIIGDKTTKEYYMLIDAKGKKIALNLNMDKMAMSALGNTPPASSDRNTGAENPVKPTMSETGETRMIDGYNCTMFAGGEKGSKSEVWVAKDIDFSLGDLLFSPNVGTQFKGYSDMKGLVLEAWQYDDNGKITSSVKLMPVKRTVDDAIFEIPKDYEKMDMTQFMQLAQGNPEMAQMIQQMFGGQK